MRMPPPLDTAHVGAGAGAGAPPVAHGLYEPSSSWRPYPSSFDPHSAAVTAAATAAAPDQRRVSSNPSQAPPIPPTHGYPVIPNRELPQLPPDGPYGRPSSLPGSATTPPDAHHHPPPPPSGNYHRVNGAGPGPGAGAPSHPPPQPHDAPPHSAPPEYRSRLPFPSSEQSANGEPVSAHSIPPAQYPTPVPPPIPQTPTPFDPPGYYQSQSYGMRQRKAARAQQVRETYIHIESHDFKLRSR